MKKTTLLLLSLLLISSSAYAAVGKDTKGPFGYNLYDDINRKPDAQKASSSKNNNETAQKMFYGDETEAEWEKEQVYYPNASINSAVNKYKNGNYAGCLQEMISLTKTDEYNPIIYYYLGMAYTQVGNKDQAVKAYEKVIKLNADKTLIQYATKGRDCLVGGPTCVQDETSETDERLEEFINSPYGNGFSEELNQQVKEQKLKNIQKTINQKQNLEEEDIEEIQKFDEKGKADDDTKLAANPTDDEILNAIKTLKKAGVTVSITPATMPVNNQFNELSMMLGNNNNNNNAMMNMLPYLLSQSQNGQKIDPQILQSVMMNSMLPDFTFSDNDKKY